MHARRTAVAVATLAAMVAAAPAHAAGTTSATVTTWIGGQQSPTAMGSAAWSSAGPASWQLDARAVAPPASTTRVVATWVGPKKWFKHGATMFAVDATLRDQPAPTTSDLMFTEQYRICGKKCDKWRAGQLVGGPYLDLTDVPPSTSDDGVGLTVTWSGPKSYLHVEWRMSAEVHDGDAGTVQVSLTG